LKLTFNKRLANLVIFCINTPVN